MVLSATELESSMKAIDNDTPEFEKFWKKGEESLKGVTILYDRAFNNYVKSVFGERLFADDSFVVVSATQEVLALVPLYAFKDAHGRLQYCYSNEYLRGPLMAAEFGSRQFNRISTFVFDHIREVARKKAVESHWAMIEAVELLEGRSYFNYLIEFGYKEENAVATLIDCRIDDKKMWSELRGSYKPLINRAKRSFKTAVVNSQNFDLDLCEEYRRLHALVSGRSTRSLESFHNMYEFIKMDKAYLIVIQDQAEKPVGAYYFFKRAPYVLYGSAATDPAVSSEGVGHLGLWEGIIAAKSQDCRFVDLGQLLIRADLTEKEKNIDMFKRGFGGKRVVVFRAVKRFDDDQHLSRV